MIRVIELESGLFKASIEEQIEQALMERGITRNRLIDIKYAREGVVAYALIIYEE
ncbi:MAG: hypothetical protein ACM3ZQ_08310 [Bacillota bacterium]